jgi:hypothetical protein
MEVVYGRNSLNSRINDLREVYVFRDTRDRCLRIIKLSYFLWDVLPKLFLRFQSGQSHRIFLPHYYDSVILPILDDNLSQIFRVFRGLQMLLDSMYSCTCFSL